VCSSDLGRGGALGVLAVVRKGPVEAVFEMAQLLPEALVG
jgi:hypothetical protein